MSWDIDRQLRGRFGPEVCETRIAENVSLAECPSHNRSVFGHAPDSRGAQDYTALLDELQACNFLQ
jgi:chromosome partitioning protein